MSIASAVWLETVMTSIVLSALVALSITVAALGQICTVPGADLLCCQIIGPVSSTTHQCCIWLIKGIGQASDPFIAFFLEILQIQLPSDSTVGLNCQPPVPDQVCTGGQDHVFCCTETFFVSITSFSAP